MGRVLPVEKVRDFFGLATCYADLDGPDRPGADVWVGKKWPKFSARKKVEREKDMSAGSRILKTSGFHLVQFNVLFGVMYGLAWLFYDSVIPVHVWFLICNLVFAIVILPYLLWTMRG